MYADPPFTERSTASHMVDTNQVRLYDMQIGFVDGLEV